MMRLLFVSNFAKNTMYFIIYSSSMVCLENCHSDSNCDSQEICVNGECQPGCYSDSQCPENQKCFQNSCYDTNMFCQHDYNCNRGQKCQDGICQDKCAWDNTCTAPDQKCLFRTCQKSCSDIICPKGSKCFQGSCYTSCEDNSNKCRQPLHDTDCHPVYKVCIPHCNKNGCPNGQRCKIEDNLYCYKPGYCRSAEDCTRNQHCDR